ncbi:ROK family transcriptional regulator [Mycobacterium sp. 236(2023)]|uniref:ROK family transcriptional regulator n=1 Tax=Mycobacterium sp. 236(2023) TaxID=3038163 RepID=UPI0024157A48|nr:ROK family transcriptional regulator [Mycobacterium sp. 236(2023)]MDG4667112.1 ROK family transcriptional regulator [Mycobacterium sp. 236(2023)]
MPEEPGSASQVRWYGAAKLIGLARAEPGITRAAAAQRLRMSSGGAADLVARLRRARLLEETPAPAQGRGRPTTVLCPHPEGPLVLAVDLRPGDWSLAQAGLDGVPRLVAQGKHGRAGHARVVDDIAKEIATAHRDLDGRVRAVSVSAAGTLSDSRLVQFTTRGWRDVDLTALTGRLPASAGLPLVLGNDATLAGLAEARSGSARDAGTVLHLIVMVGLGGTLVVNGEPVTGAHGAAGEYGHIPFGDPNLECPCGARGCWDLAIDGRALARHLGDPAPADPVAYARDLLHERPPGSAKAFDAVAADLGRGIAGLVNLHDPEIVTLGGLAPPLRAAAPEVFDDAYRGGLMTFRKEAAPPVRDGLLGDDAPLHGAAALALDHVTTEAAMADWAARYA